MTTTCKKPLWTLRRYHVNRTGSVCYITVNERGVQHETWVHANGKTACDCLSTNGRCYHRTYALAQEAARTGKPETVRPVLQLVASAPTATQMDRMWNDEQRRLYALPGNARLPFAPLTQTPTPIKVGMAFLMRS